MYNKNSSPQISNCSFIGNSANSYGGGMYNENSSPTITNCTFSDNISEKYGGGIYISHGSPIIADCIFSENFADNSGGGIYNKISDLAITDCVFTGNSAELHGGGIYNKTNSPILTNSMFNKNSADNGGGMYNSYSSPAVSNCTFTSNSSVKRGGGMGNYENSSPTITSCTFSSNSSGDDGGGMFNWESNPTVTNCIFSGNSAADKAGGMGNWHTSNALVTNCTFSVNTAADGNSMAFNSINQLHPSTLVLTNCILRDGTDGIWNNDGSEITITYSNIQGSWEGEGVIDVNPLFVDAGNGDYHLKSEGWRWDEAANEWTWDDATSPCIDTGNPGSVFRNEPETIEADPTNRFGENIRINMGAYGGTAEASMPPYGWAPLSDINNNGVCDVYDLMRFARYWLDADEEVPADFNRDETVDIADFALLAHDWSY